MRLFLFPPPPLSTPSVHLSAWGAVVLVSMLRKWINAGPRGISSTSQGARPDQPRHDADEPDRMSTHILVVQRITLSLKYLA